MSKTFKIVLILLIVASITSATLAVFAFIAKEREYMKGLLLEDKLAATLKDKRRLEKEINSSRKAREEAKAKIEEMQARIKILLSQIEEEKNKSKSIVADLSAKENEIIELKGNLENERKEKLAISKKLDDLEFDYAKARSDLTKLRDEKEEFEKRISDLKEKSVDLDTIVVNPSKGSLPPAPAAPPKKLLRGMVLVVNRDYSFVVSDLGQDDGVEKGMMFEIRDGSKFLGKAKIDKVYDTMSSATVMPGSEINSIKKGNLIIESH